QEVIENSSKIIRIYARIQRGVYRRQGKRGSILEFISPDSVSYRFSHWYVHGSSGLSAGIGFGEEEQILHQATHPAGGMIDLVHGFHQVGLSWIALAGKRCVRFDDR